MKTIKTVALFTLLSISCFSLAQAEPDFHWGATSISNEDAFFYIDDSYISDNGETTICGTYRDTVDIGFEGISHKIVNPHVDILGSYVARYSDNGSLLWVASFTNTKNSFIRSIDVNEDGETILAGEFESTMDFDPGPSSHYITAHPGYLDGAGDAFFVKLDNEGNFEWVKTVRGAAGENANEIKFDNEGNILVLGYFHDHPVDFDPGPEEYLVEIPGTGFRTFVLKLNASGEFIWVKTLGDMGNYVYGMHLDIDPDGNILIGGRFKGELDLDPDEGIELVEPIGPIGNNDYFILKLDNEGAYQWSKTFGSESSEIDCNIATDQEGNVFFGGWILEIAYYYPGEPHYPIGEGTLFFLEKLNSDGDFLWMKNIKRIGASLCSFRIQDLATDGLGNILAVGSFKGSCDFDASPEIVNEESSELRDIAIYSLDPDGNYNWSFHLGGPDDELWSTMNVSQSGNIVITADFKDNIDLNPFGPEEIHSTSRFEYFITKFNASVLSTHQFNENDNPLIYPNPTQNILNISTISGIENIMIYNLLGELVYSCNDCNEVLNLEFLSPHTYLISIFTDSQRITQKLIIN